MALDSKCEFSERFLQVIWNERLLRENLVLADGRRLCVLSPGIWNVAGGPDFHDASLLVDGRLVTGDVEIHRKSSDWFSHHHQDDPSYDAVALHVVWQDDTTPVREGIPTLRLPDCLQDGWERLLQEVDSACYPYARQIPGGGCSLKWAMTSNEKVRGILTTAGLARLAAKGQRFARMASDLGCNQALYELIFEALGYKNNRENFRRLACMVPLEMLQASADEVTREAMLFGTSGLIPDVTRQSVLPECREEVLDLWEAWWKQGIAPSSIQWNLGGTRPFNNPCRRLAAGISILRTMEYRPCDWLVDAADGAHTPKELLKRLATLNDHGTSWRHRLDFQRKASPEADLIGHARLLDMTANVFLPFLCGISFLEEGRGRFAELARALFVKLSISQENRTYKEAVHRFLTPPSRSHDLVKNLCQQQGIHYIYETFCRALDNNCAECPAGGGF